ncbi:MAG: ferredoxin [Acidimicrobiia bacterium]
MKVTLDRSACTGHGRCYALGPDVFEADDDGYGVVLVADVPPELQAQALAGQENCPERAISVEE